jgi:hypothetical protein
MMFFCDVLSQHFCNSCPHELSLDPVLNSWLPEDGMSATDTGGGA